MNYFNNSLYRFLSREEQEKSRLERLDAIEKKLLGDWKSGDAKKTEYLEKLAVQEREILENTPEISSTGSVVEKLVREHAVALQELQVRLDLQTAQAQQYRAWWIASRDELWALRNDCRGYIGRSQAKDPAKPEAPEDTRRLVWIDRVRNVGGVLPLSLARLRPQLYGLDQDAVELLEKGNRWYGCEKTNTEWVLEQPVYEQK